MRAVLLTRYGDPSALELTTDAPRPAVGPHDVLIEVHATSVNPVDTKLRAGAMRGGVRYRLPWILGLDVSGVVVEAGPRVTRFQVGDEVYASPSHRRPGCYAEYVALPEDEVARKPANISHVEAASLPLVGLTAMGCLLPRLERRAGQKVFIQAGAGGVGTFAIQLARHYGAEVTTTASEKNHALCRDLGAHHVLDYRKVGWSDVVRDADVVLESLGPRDVRRAIGVTRPCGQVSTITSGMPEHTRRFGPLLGIVVTGLKLAGLTLAGLLRGVRVKTVVRTPNARGLERITAWVEAGVIKPVVGRVFPLEETAFAHRALEEGGAPGKIVVQVR